MQNGGPASPAFLDELTSSVEIMRSLHPESYERQFWYTLNAHAYRYIRSNERMPMSNPLEDCDYPQLLQAMKTCMAYMYAKKATELPDPNVVDMVYLDAFIINRESHPENTELQIHRLTHTVLDQLLVIMNPRYADALSMNEFGIFDDGENLGPSDVDVILSLEREVVPGKETLQYILGLPRPKPRRGPFHPCYVSPISSTINCFRTSNEVYKRATEIVSSFHKDANPSNLLRVRVRYVMADCNSALNSLNYLHYNCGHSPHGNVDPSRHWLAYFVEDTANPIALGLFNLLRKPSHITCSTCPCRLCYLDENAKTATGKVSTDKYHPPETLESFRWRVCNPMLQITKLELSAICIFRFGYEIVLFEINEHGNFVAWSPAFKAYGETLVPPIAGRVFIARVDGHFSPIVLCQPKPCHEVRIFPIGFENLCFHASVHLECLRLMDYSKFSMRADKPIDRFDGKHCHRNKFLTLERRGVKDSDLDACLPPIRIKHLDSGLVEALPSFSTSKIDNNVHLIDVVDETSRASTLPVVRLCLCM